MINTSAFGAELKRMGYTSFCGVPCSYLKALINYAINEGGYLMATNEGEAVAIMAGTSIGGKKSVVLMQNSGLTNALSPLVSLIDPFQIPILGFVSLRGEPGKMDEPQHELLGRITSEMLNLLNIKWEYLSSDFEEALQQLELANKSIERNEPFFFIVKEGIFEPIDLKENKTAIGKEMKISPKLMEDQLPARYDALRIIQSLNDRNTVKIATTGKTGRELYELEDAENNLYMVGSMGCASSLGLGLALSRPDKKIITIDGDGALLMRLGSLATNGTYSPPNLLHILLDNNSHDSTGGQRTNSHNVDFVAAAAACGYDHSIYVHNLNELKSAINAWKENQALTFIYIKIAKGSKKGLGRPKIKPFEVKNRLQVFLHD